MDTCDAKFIAVTECAASTSTTFCELAEKSFCAQQLHSGEVLHCKTQSSHLDPVMVIGDGISIINDRPTRVNKDGGANQRHLSYNVRVKGHHKWDAVHQSKQYTDALPRGFNVANIRRHSITAWIGTLITFTIEWALTFLIRLQRKIRLANELTEVIANIAITEDGNVWSGGAVHQ